MTTVRSKALRAARQRGYTLVEVMMAMGIMAMGGVGIMGLHQASTKANLEARQMSTANNILRTWMERLKRDSLLWTQGGDSAATADLSPTAYLSELGNGWFVPDPVDAAESHAFDHFGRDTAVGTTMRFCTNVQVVWVVPGLAVRTDVRIWWVRRGVDGSDYASCSDGIDPNTLTGDPNLHFVSASNVVRWNSLL